MTKSPPPQRVGAGAAQWVGVPLLAIIMLWLTAVSVNADECVSVRGARLFVSSFGMQGFKLTLDDVGASGRLFTYDSHGAEKLVWESRLVNVPVDAYVAFDGPLVVTIDTTCRGGFEHSLVMYGAKGAVVADYRLEDLLTPDEIALHVRSSTSSRLWARDARVDFDERAKQFVITLSWGRIVKIALATGRVVESQDKYQ
jgi:hypothetical protein